MHSWRIREKVLNIIEATTGGRVIFGSCKIGGVRRDMDTETIKGILKDLTEIEKDMRGIAKVFLNDRSVKARLCGVGVLSKKEAWDLGCVGPTLRGSGVAQDMRSSQGYAAFKDIQVQPITHSDGDCYARCIVRCDELFQSVEIIRQAFAKIPDGEIEVKVTGNPNGETITRTEQPRGEVVLPHKGKRYEKSAAFPRPHADIRQSPGHAKGFARMRLGGCADDCAYD